MIWLKAAAAAVFPALNLYEAIAAESDILTQFGGHHQAAGLTLPAKVEEFRRRFKEYVRTHLRLEDYQPHQVVDCVVKDKGEITVQDLEELQLLEPCGCSEIRRRFLLFIMRCCITAEPLAESSSICSLPWTREIFRTQHYVE